MLKQNSPCLLFISWSNNQHPCFYKTIAQYNAAQFFLSFLKLGTVFVLLGKKCNIMKNTRLLVMALCIGTITSFAACSGSEATDENTTDSAAYDNSVVPAPMDTTNTMMDTSMTDTTKKMPQ